MSTIYDFNHKDDYIQAIKTHYFNNGWDIVELDENGETSVFEASRGFKTRDIQDTIDVFIGNVFAHLVTETDGALTIFTMTSSIFKTKWAEKVWAKFRKDSYTHTCPECGEKMAYSVAGKILSDIGKIEQFHCDKCHYTWIGYPSGKFIREGVLYSEWEIQR